MAGVGKVRLTYRRTTAALYRTAIHEAGHGVVAEALGLGCTEISIIPDPDEMTAGYCIYSVDPFDALQLWRRRGISHRSRKSAATAAAITMLAGSGAERELLGRASAGAADDLRQANWMIDDIVPAEGNVRQMLTRLRRISAGVVHRHRSAVAEVAHALMERRQLSGEVLADVLERALPYSSSVARYGAAARGVTVAQAAA